MRMRTDRVLRVGVASAVAACTVLAVSAQRSTDRDILFDSNLDVNAKEIWVIRADGSGLRPLTKSPKDSSNSVPRWSPDGLRIVFASTRHAPARVPLEESATEIYTMNRDGSGLQRLTYGPKASVDPDWSGDGKHIAFVSNRDGDWKIYVMDANGSNVRRMTTDQITNPSKSETGPAWSSDGKRIAFVSNRDGEKNEIYIMQLETSTVTRVTNNDAWDAHPAWSPDSQYLSFDSTRDGDWEIYLMRPDGSQVVRLTDHPRMDNAARWSRDGKRLAFNSTRDWDSDDLGNCEIYVMNRDGSAVRRLTTNSIKDTHPDW